MDCVVSMAINCRANSDAHSGVNCFGGSDSSAKNGPNNRSFCYLLQDNGGHTAAFRQVGRKRGLFRDSFFMAESGEEVFLTR